MGDRLYRSQTDRVLGGVCGGLAHYFSVSPLIIRLLFVLLALAGGGIGAMLYLLLWVVVPYEDPLDVRHSGPVEIAGRARVIGEDIRTAVRAPNPQTGLVVGLALVILGIFYLLRNLDISWLRWLNLDILWPVVLILVGLALVVRRLQKGE